MAPLRPCRASMEAKPGRRQRTSLYDFHLPDAVSGCTRRRRKSCGSRRVLSTYRRRCQTTRRGRSRWRHLSFHFAPRRNASMVHWTRSICGGRTSGCRPGAQLAGTPPSYFGLRNTKWALSQGTLAQRILNLYATMPFVVPSSLRPWRAGACCSKLHLHTTSHRK